MSTSEKFLSVSEAHVFWKAGSMAEIRSDIGSSA